MEDSPREVWGGTVLTVPNRHTKTSGKPPGLVAKDCYTAYFENHYGEQLVFRYDYEAKKGSLWHGDYSWEEPVQVMGGGATMILSEEEREWLHLVWRVSAEGESQEFRLRSVLDLVKAQKAIYDELLARPEFRGDTFMRRQFSKTVRRLEKEEKAILEELEKLLGIEEAERIIRNGGERP